MLVVFTVVQLLLLQGPHPFDPAYYFRTARGFPDVSPDLFTLRIGLLAPVRAAFIIFGPSEAGLYAVPLASGLVLAAAVYATMLLLFRDRVVAAGAALVAVLNVHYLANSSWLFPDTAATATFAAGFLCLVLGARHSKSGRAANLGNVATVCAGVLFGWTYLIREFSPVLLPVLVTAVFLFRYPLRRIALLTGAAIATASLELLYGWLVHGSPFVHLRLLLGRGSRPVPPGKAETIERIQSQLDGIVDTVLVFPRILLAWRAGPVFLLLIAIFVLALAMRFRDTRLRVLAVWCFGFWIVMAVLGLGSLSSGRWIVNVTNIRYWYPILPALVMGAFGGLVLLAPKRQLLRRISVAHALAIPLAALAVVPGALEFRSCAKTFGWANDPFSRWHELRSWLAMPEAQRYDVIWTDRKTRRLVPGFTRTTFGTPVWTGSVTIIDRRRGRFAYPHNPERSLILVHRDRLAPTTVRRLARRLDGWSPIFVSEDGDMVMLAYSAASPEIGAGREWSMPLTRRPKAEPGTCGIPYVRARV